MKKSLMILTLAALVTGLGAAPVAVAGSVTKHVVKSSHKVKKKVSAKKTVVHKHVNKVVHKKVSNPYHRVRVRPAYRPVTAFGSVRIGDFTFGVGFPAPVAVVATTLPPAWTYVYEQVWIEPVYQTVIVGYDPCGQPIYQEVMVSAGSYRTAKFRVFSNGAREFVCYL